MELGCSVHGHAFRMLGCLNCDALAVAASSSPFRPAKTDALPAPAVKQRWDLLPMEPIGAIVEVLTWAVAKHGDSSWKERASTEENYAALMRHLAAWRIDRESKDHESGFLHLAHAASRILFQLWFELKEKQK